MININSAKASKSWFGLFSLLQGFPQPQWLRLTTPLWTTVPSTVNLMKSSSTSSSLSATPWCSSSALCWTPPPCMWSCVAESDGPRPPSTCSTWRCATPSTSSPCLSLSTTTLMRTTGPSLNRCARLYASFFTPTYMVRLLYDAHPKNPVWYSWTIHESNEWKATAGNRDFIYICYFTVEIKYHTVKFEINFSVWK